MLRRFRRFLFVRDDAGEELYFRFYDPRVLRVFLATCQGDELFRWFDNIDCYLLEAEQPGMLLRLSAPQDTLQVDEIRLYYSVALNPGTAQTRP